MTLSNKTETRSCLGGLCNLTPILIDVRYKPYNFSHNSSLLSNSVANVEYHEQKPGQVEEGVEFSANVTFNRIDISTSMSS